MVINIWIKVKKYLTLLIPCDGVGTFFTAELVELILFVPDFTRSIVLLLL